MKAITTGTENFKEFIDKNYYYVDKTQLIEDVMSDKVMLYTRPRRFGKTLNMSMLYYFFSNKEKENAYLFDDLYVSKNEVCKKHQNQYPVIFLTLKDMTNNNFQSQLYKFSTIIAEIVDKYEEILENPLLNKRELTLLMKYQNLQANSDELKNALYDISKVLYKCYGKKVIIIVDEYDVPLQSGHLYDYYDEMVDFLKVIFSSALKTNDALERGIMTGCLRISKESIFTGLNNFTVRSIVDIEASSCFGFTQSEIDELLSYYQLLHKHTEMKEWYDGYSFGGLDIYNSWSTLNFIKKLIVDKQFCAVSFWANTSGNDLVKKYIENGTVSMKEEFEKLIQGQSIIKSILPEITYREMYFDNVKTMNDNVYSFLLFTGYLKIQSPVYNENNERVPYTYELVIPNKEVKYIYKDLFIKWFENYKNERQIPFVDALLKEDVETANSLLLDILMRSISYFDNYESFYHGFMDGFLTGCGYNVKSNGEAGEGRFDVVILPYNLLQTAIVLECKHSSSVQELRKDSTIACKQIVKNKHREGLQCDGYEKVLGYGISFYKKQCVIQKVK